MECTGKIQYDVFQQLKEHSLGKVCLRKENGLVSHETSILQCSSEIRVPIRANFPSDLAGFYLPV